MSRSIDTCLRYVLAIGLRNEVWWLVGRVSFLRSCLLWVHKISQGRVKSLRTSNILEMKIRLELMHIRLYCYHRPSLNKMSIMRSELQISSHWRSIYPDVSISCILVHMRTSLRWINKLVIRIDSLILHSLILKNVLAWVKRLRIQIILGCTCGTESSVLLDISLVNMHHIVALETYLIISVRWRSLILIMNMRIMSIFILNVLVLQMRTRLRMSQKFLRSFKLITVSSRRKSNLKLLQVNILVSYLNIVCIQLTS